MSKAPSSVKPLVSNPMPSTPPPNVIAVEIREKRQDRHATCRETMSSATTHIRGGGPAVTYRPMTARVKHSPPQRHFGRKQAKTVARGYGAAHQKRRKQLARLVAAGSALCGRCGGWIAPDGRPCPRCGKLGCGWDLGHVDLDRGAPTSPEHACCNRATAGRSRRRGRRRALASLQL